MKKIFLILFLCCFTLNNAYSFFPLIFKFDVMGGETMDVFGKVGENAENVENTVKDTSLITQIGEGFKEANKWVKEQVKKAKGFIEKAKEYKEAYDTVKKEVYDNKLMQIKTLNDDISSIKNRYDNINAEISNIKNNIESALSADKALLDGKINTLELNRNAYLKAAEQATDEEEKAAYLQQADEMAAEKDAFKKQLEALNKEAVNSVKDATKALDREKKNVERDLKKLYADLKLLLNIKDDGDDDPEKAMQYTIDTYFLSYDAKETPDAMEEKRYNRLVERRAAIINAYETAAKVIPDMQAYIEEGEDLGYSASTFDTIGGAVGAMAEMRIKNLQALKSYADLLVADIKMRSAIAVAGLNFYKLQKPEQNLQTFNLDDYIYEEAQYQSNSRTTSNPDEQSSMSDEGMGGDSSPNQFESEFDKIINGADSERECNAVGGVWSNNSCSKSSPSSGGNGDKGNSGENNTSDNQENLKKLACVGAGNDWNEATQTCKEKSMADKAREECAAKGDDYVYKNGKCQTKEEDCTNNGKVWQDGKCISKTELADRKAREECAAKGDDYVYKNRECLTKEEDCEIKFIDGRRWSTGMSWLNGECLPEEEACGKRGGYVWYNNSCITNDEKKCIDKYGQREYSSGCAYGDYTIGKDECEQKTGYVWNSEYHVCRPIKKDY